MRRGRPQKEGSHEPAAGVLQLDFPVSHDFRCCERCWTTQHHASYADSNVLSSQRVRRRHRLDLAVAGALMPDAHVGYGLPIGGVLATENAVIPYAVGVDIACRMKMTVLDIPMRELDRRQDRLARAIEAETRFGVGSTFKNRRKHEVLDTDWDVSPVTKQNKDRAWSQLGTSGSGNHSVEFGWFTAHGKIHGL